MPSYIRKKLGSWQFASGQRNALSIDRDGILYQLNINLSFTITNTATPPVGVLSYALARILQRFEVQLNGRDTIINSTGEQLVARALAEFTQLPAGLDSTVVLTANAVTNYNITIPVALFLPRSVNPRDTGLECRTLGQVTVGCTFANANCSDIFTTPNGATISAVQCLINGEYIVDAPVKKLSDPDYFVRCLDFVTQPVTGTNNNLQTLMDRGNLLYRSFHILAQQNNINVDNVVNNIKLQSGSFVYLDQSAVTNRASLLSDFGLYAAPAANAPLTGNYRVELCKFGSLATAINMQEVLTDLNFYNDVTFTSGTTQLIISRESVRKPNIG